MSTKAPIYLKRRSTRGKKERLRDILSSDMISPPLGDFRHTIHIGSGGGEDNLFGDLSFLEGKFHLLPGQQGHGEPFRFSRTASVSGRLPSSESSPLLKNALSLPVIGGLQAINLPLASSLPTPCSAPPPKPPRLHLDDKALGLPSCHPALGPTSSPGGMSGLSPPRTPRFSSTDDVCIQDPYVEDEGQEGSYMSHAGSLLSLHLDLGPSILDDVLQIMDNQRLGGLNANTLQGGRQEIYT